MHRNRKLATILVACAIPLGTLGGLALTSPAWARAVSHHKSGGATTGTVNCSGATGSVGFSPPLTPSGTAPEKKVTVSASLGSCTSSGKTVTITSAKYAIKIGAGSKASCASFATGTSADSLTISLKYSGGPKPTTIKFPAGSISAVIGPPDGFSATGGTATGSYAGPATFSVTLSTASSTQIGDCVGGSGSVSTLQIASGSSSF